MCCGRKPGFLFWKSVHRFPKPFVKSFFIFSQWRAHWVKHSTGFHFCLSIHLMPVTFPWGVMSPVGPCPCPEGRRSKVVGFKEKWEAHLTSGGLMVYLQWELAWVHGCTYQGHMEKEEARGDDQWAWTESIKHYFWIMNSLFQTLRYNRFKSILHTSHISHKRENSEEMFKDQESSPPSYSRLCILNLCPGIRCKLQSYSSCLWLLTHVWVLAKGSPLS